MGLDITAYNNAVLTDPHVNLGTWCEEYNHVQAFAYAGFERSFRGLADPDKKFDGFIGGRCYDVSESEAHAFRAGSYGGYNHWRSMLADAFHTVGPDDPFYELVHFADNEGAIGPEAAKDLLADFREHRDAWFNQHSAEMHRSYAEVYDDWLKACELAADDGFIDFH